MLHITITVSHETPMTQLNWKLRDGEMPIFLPQVIMTILNA